MTTNAPSFAVLGFRPHTYWTAVVALAGRPDAPRVLERRRIVFADGEERFVYHHAAEAPAASAPSLIAAARAATQTNATREISELIADLQLGGVAVRTAVVPGSGAKSPEKLEDVLRSHARIHAAEGAFYRDVVASACQVTGLEVHRVVERHLPALVSGLLDVEGSELAARLKEIGAALGPPWGEDYRLATQAAWLHLEGAGASPAG
jgi:hypothetical protein